MYDQSSLKDNSSYNEGNSKMNATYNKDTKKESFEPKWKVDGYVDGETKVYRGRNMQSFCRASRASIFDPEIELVTLANPRLQMIFSYQPSTPLDELKKAF